MPPRNAVEEFVDNVAGDYQKAFGDILGQEAGDEDRAARMLAAPALALALFLPATLRQAGGLGMVTDGVLGGLDLVRSLLVPADTARPAGGRAHGG
ncbi:hypothetical protein ACFY9A_08780 [Streptomyces rubradiris]|uniref:hypothetical protein n=1 Tax=Streptomyces rubradiris TaxID=285531 RepID=UPI0036E394BD